MEVSKENGAGAPPPPEPPPPPPPVGAASGAVGPPDDKCEEAEALEEPAMASGPAAAQAVDEGEHHYEDDEADSSEEVVMTRPTPSVPLEPPPAPPSRSPGGLALSQLPDHLSKMGSMACDPDDDDVELAASSPLVSLGVDPEEPDRPGLSGKLPAEAGDKTSSPEGALPSDPTSDTGDQDPSARARDLISRELLDELSHEPDDWNEGRNAPTPPQAGWETPSEPNTPRENAPTQYYHSGQNADGLMCIDQWDWKTDAPEFVPGSMKGLVSHQPHAEPQQVVNAGFQSGWAIQPPAAGRGRFAGAFSNNDTNTYTNTQNNADSGAADSSNAANESVQLNQLRQQYEWQLRSKSEELRDMQQRMNQLEIETAQVRASWEIERRNLVRQIVHYRAVLERYCIPLEETGNPSYNLEEQQQYYAPFEPSAPSQWAPDAAVSSTGGASPTPAATGGGAVGSGGAAAYVASAQQASFVGNAPGGGYVSSGAPAAAYLAQSADPGSGCAVAAADADGLDSKMRALNNLLKEGQDQQQQRTRRWPNGNQSSESAATYPAESSEPSAVPEAGNFNSIASTLRAMFPHANIRTSTRPTGRDEEIDGLDPDVAEEMDNDALNPEDDSEKGLSQGVSAAVAPEYEARAIGIENHVRRIERSSGGHLDDRAMRSLLTLTTREAKEALVKVEETVHAQGGQCRNLSSIMQAVCRKLQKKNPKLYKDDDSLKGSANGGSRGPAIRSDGRIRTASGPSRRARRLDEDGDAFDSSDSDPDGGCKVTAGSRTTSWPQEFQRAAAARGGDEPLGRTLSQNTAPDDKGTPASRRSKSWADIQSGDEDEGREAGLGPDEHPGLSLHDLDEDDPWTPSRVDKAARKGFELRRRSGDHWDLKICMSALEPALTEVGMERYCRWLRVRLTSFRDEHGAESLRRCRGEVDFSHNRMTNQMVWMLLETLAQHEVHTALLKLFANHISQGGVLAICEFIRMNVYAEALQELHLSHNEIDDDAALELLRTLQAGRPRYPPRRPSEGTGEPVYVPVWLRLNHNRIRDPEHVRRTAEAEGISICAASDRQVCGTSKCFQRNCPLVHLYSFSVQDVPRESIDPNGEARGRRKRNKKDRGKDGSKKDGDADGMDDADPAAASAADVHGSFCQEEDA